MAKTTAGEKTEKPKEVTFKLSDGRTAKIVRGKGKTAMNAQRLISGMKINASEVELMYNVACMSLLTTIDGKGVTMEDLQDLDMADFHRCQMEYTEINL